jgi:hypothetical protein
MDYHYHSEIKADLEKLKSELTALQCYMESPLDEASWKRVRKIMIDIKTPSEHIIRMNPMTSKQIQTSERLRYASEDEAMRIRSESEFNGRTIAEVLASFNEICTHYQSMNVQDFEKNEKNELTDLLNTLIKLLSLIDKSSEAA